MTKRKHLQSKLTITTLIFMLTISLMSLGGIYYWSFYHFKTIFEDRIIDDYTFEHLNDMGVKNEWILGVTTNSIDVIEAVHKDKIARHIKEQAEQQTTASELYRETIDDKHLLYQIDLDVSNGEAIYKYSIIRDIYAEIFPQLTLFFVGFTFFLLLASYIYTQYITNTVYSDIRKLRVYTNSITNSKPPNKINIETHDEEFENLVTDLEIMHQALQDENAIRQSTLQYLSHELKTPIMIIEGYATSAKDGIYPTGDIEGTLDTILTQTVRMKQKVKNLLTVIKLESPNVNKIYDYHNVNELIITILQSLEYQMQTKHLVLSVPEIKLYGDKDTLMILFENLITNQIKYSKKHIMIEAYENKEAVIFNFSNDGTKINPLLQKNLLIFSKHIRKLV